MVAGYAVAGSALSYESPLADVLVTLFSTDPKDADKAIDVPEESIAQLKAERGEAAPKLYAAKQTRSNAKGFYEFSEVRAGGPFFLTAFIREEHAKFTVEPKLLEVEVAHAPLLIDVPFQVTGFSIVGKVVDSKGDGVPGVRILLDAQEKGLTNEKGIYKLDEVSLGSYNTRAGSEPGLYLLEGYSDHYFFEPMKVKIDANSRSIPDLVVSEVHLCGSLRISNEDRERFPSAKRAVILRD